MMMPYENKKKRKLNKCDNEQSIKLETVRFQLKITLDKKNNNHRNNTPIAKREADDNKKFKNKF